ncbi:MAG TPA: ATP-binding cassette domain-containing protein [Aggregatilinea sp.]|uniref:ABC transporter ATP-binding protein n=1 Tax=Aggregatilinea sp. TaxID=2806333 RepID=UPI002BD78D69|nr:ATP-binding cassette domain-containing protein [Aggregatilinea sp.]HML20517.1 ATP-binding cassette domain-containing protein [Aggregatilinea sp.]
MITVENLKKSYGAIQALNDVSFQVEAGEIVGMLGPNGAGKSTTIKILTGYLHPDSGSVTINGLDILTHTQEVQAQIGYLPETTPLYGDLSVQFYLKLMADMRGIPAADQPPLISEAIVVTSLQNFRARPISQLSKGLRQRVGLAQAILHRPRLLILDEPMIGLDPTQIVEIRNLIRRLAQTTTVLFSTHILSEVEALCDRVIVLMGGEVKADARLSDLSRTADMVLVLGQDGQGVAPQLQALPAVDEVQTFRTPEGWPAYRVVSAQDLCPTIYDLARSHDWPVRELKRETLTLEAIFNQLVAAEG